MSDAEKIFERQYECDWDKLEKLEIDIRNPTGLPQFINLFAYSLQNVTAQYPALVFSDPVSYDILVQDLEYSPIKARKILFASTSQPQLSNPVLVQSRYAEGNESEYTEFPILAVDTQQRQGNRVEVVFDDLTLDAFTSFSNYQINAGDTVTILLYYRQLKRICIRDFPTLFPDRKPVTPAITEDIVEAICEREEDFKGQDHQLACKKDKNIFELSMTNNGATQQFINLFDNFRLLNSNFLTAPINTITLNVNADSSSDKFTQWTTGNNLAYTINGLGINLGKQISRFDNLANLTIEFSLAVAINSFAMSQKFSKMYLSGATADIREYDLGSGLAPASFPQGIATQGVAVDDTNEFLWVLRAASATITRLDLNNLATSTIFALPAIPTSILNIEYFDTANEVISQSGNTLIGTNPITGVSTVRFTMAIGSFVERFLSIPDLSGFAFISSGGGISTITLLDSGYNVVGSYSQVTDLQGITYDPTRKQIITVEDGGLTRMLFFTVASLANSTFVSSVVLGAAATYLGFFPNKNTVIIGDKASPFVATLNRNPTVQFANPDSYDFFTESLGEEPVKVSCMDVISTSQSQLGNNLVIQTKDADGHVQSDPRTPITEVSTWQEQGTRSFLEFEKLIFEGNTTFASYPINGGETVTLIFYYHQFKRASLLSKSGTRTPIQIPKPIIDYGKLDAIANRDLYECAKVCKKIEIKVTNATGADATFNFFAANQTQIIVNQASATFDNVEDYNFLIQQIRQSPLVLCGIEFIGTTQQQLVEPVIVNTKDADGDRFAYQHFPINFVDTNQRNGNRVFLKMNHLILDGYSTFPLYNIQAGNSITFVLYYRQYLRSTFIKDKFFPVVRKPLVSNGSEVGEDIEYYNDITESADNTSGIDGSSTKQPRKYAENSRKSPIFDTEQVYSNGLNSSRSDFLMSFYKKVNIMYAHKRGVFGCEIPKANKQIIYVDPHDLSFGKQEDFPVRDISEQGMEQFDKVELKPIGSRQMTEGEEPRKGIAYRWWLFDDKTRYQNQHTALRDYVVKQNDSKGSK
jgi:hypothetical protein